MRTILLVFGAATALTITPVRAQDSLRTESLAAMRKAAMYYHGEVATHGGYVYHYSLDLTQRWGEGVATKNQIWVQPPGTPTVGMAFLEAYEATGDKFYLDAATDAAKAIVYGQLKSGGWTNSVDFDLKGDRLSDYRNGKGHGKNNSSLDDGQTQSAIRLLIHSDKSLKFGDAAIHDAAIVALDALLLAQFPCGAFPQVWTGPVSPQPVRKAKYPEHDWQTKGRIKNYWDMYTLNDDVAGYVAELLIDAHRIYGDKRYRVALENLGDFLLLAQMPQPQPGWAQQYSYQMYPIWARKFEPPGVSGDETQEVLTTLMRIFQATGDEKYLAPIPTALAWLRRSQLPDGRIARYYELQSNRPLYMTRDDGEYRLTFDDSNLPDHYGWKTDSRLSVLTRQFKRIQSGTPLDLARSPHELDAKVKRILEDLDDRGRWVSQYTGERLVGQAKMPVGSSYLSSQVFSDNLSTLANFVARSK